MDIIRKGDIVTKSSYGSDILFYVDEIIKTRGMSPIAILKGVTLRIEDSATLDDLNLENTSILNKKLEQFDIGISDKTSKILELFNEKDENRKVLENNKTLIMHLDGDKKYAEKSAKVYSKLKIKAVVKNVKESKQPYEIVNLLNRYNPDVVVLTGHDGMIKKGYRYNDIYNYRNSKHFVKTVKEIRNWEQGENKISIFAGACQSYYEAIMEAGANFASSPARILIDFMDPLIIAQRIATTPETRYVTINDIKNNLRDGERGISGIGSYGKLRL